MLSDCIARSYPYLQRYGDARREERDVEKAGSASTTYRETITRLIYLCCSCDALRKVTGSGPKRTGAASQSVGMTVHSKTTASNFTSGTQ